MSGNHAQSVEIYGPVGTSLTAARADVQSCKLEFLAEGSTCCCYKITEGPYEGYLLKEFCPCGANRKSENKPIELKGEKLNEKYNDFLNMKDFAVTLGTQYREGRGNLFEIPRLFETSLGKCYLYEDFNGCVVSSVEPREGMTEQLIQSLKITLYTLNDLMNVHESGCAHLDIKPGNIFCIYMDSKTDFRCRSIDLGSCVRFPDGDEWEKLSESDFVSTQGAYETYDITGVISFCGGGNTDDDEEDPTDEEKKNVLKWLDLKACAKMMVELILRDPDVRIETIDQARGALEMWFKGKGEKNGHPFRNLCICDRLCQIIENLWLMPYENGCFYSLDHFRCDLCALLEVLEAKCDPGDKDTAQRIVLAHKNLERYYDTFLRHRMELDGTTRDDPFDGLLEDYLEKKREFDGKNPPPCEYWTVAKYYRKLLETYL